MMLTQELPITTKSELVMENLLKLSCNLIESSAKLSNNKRFKEVVDEIQSMFKTIEEVSIPSKEISITGNVYLNTHSLNFAYSTNRR